MAFLSRISRRRRRPSPSASTSSTTTDDLSIATTLPGIHPVESRRAEIQDDYTDGSLEHCSGSHCGINPDSIVDSLEFYRDMDDHDEESHTSMSTESDTGMAVVDNLELVHHDNSSLQREGEGNQDDGMEPSVHSWQFGDRTIVDSLTLARDDRSYITRWVGASDLLYSTDGDFESLSSDESTCADSTTDTDFEVAVKLVSGSTRPCGVGPIPARFGDPRES